jgi:uncharacterized protein YgfB (UPF0149 family)
MSDYNLPHYLTIEEDLQTLTIPLTAAEAHGLIAGVLCATKSDETALTALFSLSDEILTNDAIVDDAKKEIRKLCKTTAQQFMDINFGFQLLLPNDEVNLAKRSAAIGLWCQGFISGLGEGKLEKPLEQQDELKELIRDFSEIAKIDSENIIEDEEQEIDFNELLEFVRVAALTIHADLLMENKNLIRHDVSQHIH